MRFVSIFVSWGFSQSWRCDCLEISNQNWIPHSIMRRLECWRPEMWPRSQLFESTLKMVVPAQPVWLTGGLQKPCGSMSHRLMKLNPHRCFVTVHGVRLLKQRWQSLISRYRFWTESNQFKICSSKSAAPRSGKVRDVPGATVITDEVGHCVRFYATLKHCSFCYWTSRLEKNQHLGENMFFFSATICLINFCFSNEAIFAVPCKPIGSGPNVETRSSKVQAGKPPPPNPPTTPLPRP